MRLVLTVRGNNARQLASRMHRCSRYSQDNRLNMAANGAQRCERMKGNACVDSLAASARRPDEGQIGKDLGFVADSNPLVKTLVRWRHNAIAHRNARHAIDPQEFAKRSPVSFADMQTLIDEGIGILNRYGSLFHANTHASSMVGHDDYRSVTSPFALI